MLQQAAQYRGHPTNGPEVLVVSGGSGARNLSRALTQYTANATHVLPTFDDGGSSRVLRKAFAMPAPGDLRNRIVTLIKRDRPGAPALERLMTTRLERDRDHGALSGELTALCDGSHALMRELTSESRARVTSHLRRFQQARPPDLDLRGGNIGNFVLTGAYLTLTAMNRAVVDFADLIGISGTVLPVSCDGNYHLKARFRDDTEWIGQAKITHHADKPIDELAIVESYGDGWRECKPPLNPLVATAVESASVIAYVMGSFYTSLVSNLLVDGIGEAIRCSPQPKIFVANLVRDAETPEMTVSQMVEELYRALRRSDPNPGPIEAYVNHAIVGTHGDDDSEGRVPVDEEAIRQLGVQPLVIPLEAQTGIHDAELVASSILSHVASEPQAPAG